MIPEIIERDINEIVEGCRVAENRKQFIEKKTIKILEEIYKINGKQTGDLHEVLTEITSDCIFNRFNQWTREQV
jgi:chorismate mutase